MGLLGRGRSIGINSVSNAFNLSIDLRTSCIDEQGLGSSETREKDVRMLPWGHRRKAQLFFLQSRLERELRLPVATIKSVSMGFPLISHKPAMCPKHNYGHRPASFQDSIVHREGSYD